MASQRVTYLQEADLRAPTLVMGFSGWMDGGSVSTGTIEYLVSKLDAEPLAELEVEDCYLLNFPGSMEISALFRPHCKIEDGLLSEFDLPANGFYACRNRDVILFVGKEPNINWTPYVDALFEAAGRFGVAQMVFIGSVAGAVPHTRDPRWSCSVSDEGLKAWMSRFGVGFGNYEGPASITTYVTARAAAVGVPHVNLVAEVPAYVQGENPRCVGAAARLLGAICDFQIDLSDLDHLAHALEEKVAEAIAERPELAERIHQMEEDYDNEVFEDMGDLKDWLEQRGIRLD